MNNALNKIKKGIEYDRLPASLRLGLVAVVLFLLFDLTALSLNIWLSYRIEQQAVEINLAGRQRMLSQRMTKALVQLEKQPALNQQIQLDEELKHTFQLFNQTLISFAEGGSTLSTTGELVSIESVGGQARPFVNRALILWQPLRSQLSRYIDTDFSAEKLNQLQQSVNLASRINLELLDLMDRLTLTLEQQTQREARSIRIFQAVAFGLALLNFAFAVLVYHRRFSHVVSDLSLIDTIMNQIKPAVLVVDAHGRIVKVNNSAGVLFVLSEHQLLERNIDQLLLPNHQHQNAIKSDGGRFDAQVEIRQAYHESQPVLIYTVTDITEQRRQQNRLSSMAFHDQLTGLPNRVLFDNRLCKALESVTQENGKLAMIFIDLDLFKEVNDTYGHLAGDMLLQQFATRLRQRVRQTDIVSRRGGDEFTLVLTHIHDRQTCEQFLAKLMQEMIAPYHCGPVELVIGMSVGVSFYPEDTHESGELMENADKAMYAAKAHGGNCAFYWQDICRKGDQPKRRRRDPS